MFNCYEKCCIYIKCAIFVQGYNNQLLFEYLQQALKYCENRSYYYEQSALHLLAKTAKYSFNNGRFLYYIKKIREFYDRYFPNQNIFIDMFIKDIFFN